MHESLCKQIYTGGAGKVEGFWSVMQLLQQAQVLECWAAAHWQKPISLHHVNDNVIELDLLACAIYSFNDKTLYFSLSTSKFNV